MLLSVPERRLGIAERLSRRIPESNGTRMARIFVIGRGYDNANDIVGIYHGCKVLADP